MHGAAVPELVPTSSFRSLSLAGRETVYQEGTAAGPLFEIAVGSVGLLKSLGGSNRQIVELLGPGDVFGFTTIGRHQTTAQAFERTELIVYEADLLRQVPALQLAIVTRMGSQVCVLHEMSLTLGRKSARERVATFLLMMLERFPVGPAARRNDPPTIRLFLTRRETADFLGLRLETVSREFSYLSRRGVLSCGHGGSIRVNRVSSLRRLSGDGAGDA
jgi:CRP-like cAMP-binding protein